LEHTGNQYFLPKRLLAGIMPSSLLNQYQFWQNPDDSLNGYMPKNKGAAITRTALFVELNKYGQSDFSGFCNSKANAIISRIHLDDNVSRADMEFDLTPDTTHPKLYLINAFDILAESGSKFDSSVGYFSTSSLVKDEKIQASKLLFNGVIGEDKSLHSLIRLMLRLDSISNILLWSLVSPDSKKPISIDVIELPRLRLTFEKKTAADGTFKFYCKEQSGLFIIGYQDHMQFGSLLSGLHNIILLSNIDEEFFVLIPAIGKPTSMKSKGSESYSIVTSLTDQEWVANSSDTAYFLYPIHSSGSFMSSRSIGSTLFLLLLRLLSRNYKESFKLIQSCVCDGTFTKQENLIYNEIMNNEDNLLPDSNACRLKLFFVTFGCTDIMNYEFNVEEEMQAYNRKIKLVSANCRLSPDEEIFILSQINVVNKTIQMTNRERIIKASFDLTFNEITQKSVNRSFAPMYPMQQKEKPFVNVYLYLCIYLSICFNLSHTNFTVYLSIPRYLLIWIILILIYHLLKL
jgi:hypothetical protein